MDVIPAIDLLGGRVVRLRKGDYESATAYADDPVAQAEAFARAGATRLHVVDLDGARAGEPGNLAPIETILARTALKVQVGGGVRSRSAAERWLSTGADRVVLGTVAVHDADLAASLCAEHPGSVVIAIDARGDEVAVEGWRERTGRTVRELAERASAWGAAAILYTDIDRDGTTVGPAVERTAELQRIVAPEVIASGGVGTLDDLRALRDAGVRAAVCGRALYESAFTLEEALAAVRGRAER